MVDNTGPAYELTLILKDNPNFLAEIEQGIRDLQEGRGIPYKIIKDRWCNKNDTGR